MVPRDDDIYQKFLAGSTVKDLLSEYHLSATGIRKILAKERLKKRKGDPDIKQIDIVCDILGVRNEERGRIQSIMHKHGYTSFDDAWLMLSRDDILKIPRLGPDSAAIIWLAQEMDIDKL